MGTLRIQDLRFSNGGFGKIEYVAVDCWGSRKWVGEPPASSKDIFVAGFPKLIQPQIPLIRIRRKIKNVNQLGCRKQIGTYGQKILRATGDYMLVDIWPDN